MQYVVFLQAGTGQGLLCSLRSKGLVGALAFACWARVKRAAGFVR